MRFTTILSVLAVVFVASAMGSSPRRPEPAAAAKAPVQTDYNSKVEAALGNVLSRLSRGKEGSVIGFNVLSDYMASITGKVRDNIRLSKQRRVELRTANDKSVADMSEARSRVARFSMLITRLRNIIGLGATPVDEENAKVLAEIKQTLIESSKYLTVAHRASFLELASAPAHAAAAAAPSDDEVPSVPATDAQDIREIHQKESESNKAHAGKKRAAKALADAMLALKTAKTNHYMAVKVENETSLKRLLFLRRVAKKLIKSAKATRQSNALAILAINEAIKRDGELVTIVKLLRASLIRLQAQKSSLYDVQIARAKKAFAAVKLGVTVSAAELAPTKAHAPAALASVAAKKGKEGKAPALVASKASPVHTVVSRNIKHPEQKTVEKVTMDSNEPLAAGDTVTIPVL